MKGFMLMSALLFTMVVLGMGLGVEGQIRSKGLVAQRISGEIARLDTEAQVWQKWRAEEGSNITDACRQVLNDLDTLARAHRLVYALSSDGAEGPDRGPAVRDFVWPGVKAVRMRCVFSGVVHRGRLLALCDSLDALQKFRPVLLRKVHYEKDSVVVDLTVMGVGV